MNDAISKSQHELPKPLLPSWIMRSHGSQTLENAAFSCGSALALLHGALKAPYLCVPSNLLRNRLALRAAQTCCKIKGRSVSEMDLRDALLLATPDDAGVMHRGPDGDMLALWRSVAAFDLRRADWAERYVTSCPISMQAFMADLFADTPEALHVGTPVAQARAWVRVVLEAFPRQEAVAFQCADIALAKALGWARPIPLCALHLKRAEFRTLADGDVNAFELAFTASLTKAANDATRLAYDLARRTAQLKAIAPKLRTKGAKDALQLFLTQDAIYPPTMLSPTIRGSRTPMNERSARRFCDRLVELGVVRELTGRATFRLYGVA